MSTKEKNLLMYFLEVSKTDNGCTKKWEDVVRRLSRLADKLGVKIGTPENREFIELESDIVDLFKMTRDTYFDFGATANEVIETYDLEWTPVKLEEIKAEIDKKIA